MDITRYCILGNVDASKSSLIGVLKTGELDDGKGKSRSSILQMKHEKESGNTTNSNLVKIYKSKNIIEGTSQSPKEGTSQSPKEEGVSEYVQDYIQLIDLPGHKKYFGMVLRGIMEYNPSYAIIVISSLKGIEEDHVKGKGLRVMNMTKVHINVCLFLKLPIMIVIGKVDNCPKDRLKKTIDEVKSYTKTLGCKKFFSVKDKVTFKQAVDDLTDAVSFISIPCFLLSNVTGENIDLFKNFLFQFKSRSNLFKESGKLNDFARLNKIKNVFEIYKTYYVNGVGLIVFGYNKLGIISKDDIINIGPIGNRYIKIRIKSLHDDERNEVKFLEEGRYGCLAIKSIDLKDKLNKKHLHKGKVVTDSNIIVHSIITDCKISHHQTTIEKRYKAYLHSANVGCNVSILNAPNFPIRTDDNTEIEFKFDSPQFIYPGCKFVFREEDIKGYGIIKRIN